MPDPMLEAGKPGWYMRLLYLARRTRWEITRSYHEPEYYLLPFLADPPRAAIDVGGNYGAYAGKLATLVPRVHCFEPGAAMAAMLRKRMPANVIVHEAAATDQAGMVEFFMPDRARDAGSLATIEQRNPVTDTPGQRIRVAGIRLDEAVTEPVGFIKIDVEGHELAVLRGAERLLREDRPTLLVEASPLSNPDAPDDVLQHMAGHGYSGFFLFKGRLAPLSAFRKDVHQRRDAHGGMQEDFVFNFVFMPASTPAP